MIASNAGAAESPGETSRHADEAGHRALIAGLPGSAVFVVGHDLRYRLAEGEALRAAGLDPADFVGKSVAELASPDRAAAREAHYRRALAGEPFAVEHEVGGRTFLTRGAPLRAASGAIEAALVVSFDITAHKEAEAALRASEARLAHLALHDPLTGLPNRRGLGAALGSALARLRRGGPPVALLYVDLDGFKGINDALGHEAGDYLLGETADRLRACARAGDTPARLGGDEFALLLEGAGTADVRAVAARAVAALREPVRIGTATATISASVGVATATAGEDADALLRRADAALYAAKRAGKGRVRFAAD